MTARQRAEARVAPLTPWDAPRDRSTEHHVDPRDADSEAYRVWLDASLADIAGHFAAAVAHPTDDRRRIATNLALARLLRAALLAARRGDVAALDEMAESARLYLQKSMSPKDDVAFPVPERPEARSTRSTRIRHGDPPGSFVVVPGGDIVASSRQEPAVVLRDALAVAFSPGSARSPSDAEIVSGAWSYFTTALFEPIVRDLAAPLPPEPDEALAGKLAAAVHQARLAAKGTDDDAEDTAERVLRALLRALGYPATKTRSLLDPLRKKPPAET